MNILIDGMGGDNAPEEIVKGAIQASNEINGTITIIGRQDDIEAVLKQEKWNGNNIEIENATEVITNNEAPAMAVRKKKDSSISKGMQLVKDGKYDVFISGGSTGALLSGGLLILGRIKGIKRPAIATFFPKIGKEGSTLLLDCGANVEAKPEYLLQFGIMGSIFTKMLKGIDSPEVQLLNVGAEAEKGNDLHKEAYLLLEASNINFTGNIEGRDVIEGNCDVVVADGFSGNVFLKASEGIALSLMKLMKDKLMESTASKIGAMLSSKKLHELKKEFDYSEEGGAPILGLKGAVLKIHGSSKANAVYNAILKAQKYVESDVTGNIERAIAKSGQIGEKSAE